ncbi:ethanolamine kinase [Mayamaea pseudoterrestris]|nr:ethanolamine kinase [Mayamaea pseudoterrestris]
MRRAALRYRMSIKGVNNFQRPQLHETGSKMSLTTVVARSSSTTSLSDKQQHQVTLAKWPIYRNNASLVLPVTIDGSSTHCKDQIQQVISTFCDIDVTSSRADTSSDFTVEPLSGGLSNELFVATHMNDCYLVRIHPDNSSSRSLNVSSCPSLVDREQETKLLAWLAEQSLAPTLHGRFENGRVEEFYPIHEPLTIADMTTYAPDIAALMGRMHAQIVPENILPACHCLQGDAFGRIDRWFDMARGFGKHGEFLDELEAEWVWLQQALRNEFWNDEAASDNAVRFGREIVLCHMDAQSLNFLMSSDSESSLKMIDYEYSSRNARVYDIANTFCEFGDMNHMAADFSRDYPSRETQDVFLQSYLNSCGHSNPLLEFDARQQDEYLATLRCMIAKSTLISHLGWSVWSVVQDSMAHISFDYMQYAQHRLDGYCYNKETFWEC